MAVISGKKWVSATSDDDDGGSASVDVEELLELKRLTITDSKKLLVLDLNGLLVHTFMRSKKVQIPNSRRPDAIVGKKRVFKRPFCDEFLRFCFQRFDVGIWSSAIKRNVEGVIDCALGELRSRLVFIWDQSDCTNTGLKTINDPKKPLFLKELKKIWDNESSYLPWSKGRYSSSSNTLLIDDSPYKALLNPANTAIFPHPYMVEHVDDDGLGPQGEMRMFLEGLADAEDVPSYVAANPFGQPAITATDPNWDFYSQIIYSLSNDH
ncbi:hypothetical protein QJS04_geneDACA008377 [Acorus gramineus]|uniref:Mitochondrial import inner membrane translocase subunit TIM50 n=1 Tax=Acorus gramineus TaxID=55184 RepID=A0AAV9AHS6_ACOGR|nr:hypothetical protein QJS04_geneDACA008377 [Acorus gramineus]